MERYGYSDRDAQRMRRRLDERHKREARRTRIDLLLEGVTAIESVYRDVLAAPAPPLNRDRPALALHAAGRGRGARACRDAREAFTINEKGLVRLIALCMASRDGEPLTAFVREHTVPVAIYAIEGFGTLPPPAGVAQTVEQLTRNEQAKGSSPFSGSNHVVLPARRSSRSSAVRAVPERRWPSKRTSRPKRTSVRDRHASRSSMRSCVGTAAATANAK